MSKTLREILYDLYWAQNDRYSDCDAVEIAVGRLKKLVQKTAGDPIDKAMKEIGEDPLSFGNEDYCDGAWNMLHWTKRLTDNLLTREV